MRTKSLWLVVLCVLLAVPAAFSLDEIYKRGNYVTEYVPWLSPTPYQQKPRVLVFSTFRVGAGRYARELSDRFDFEYQLVLTAAGKLIGENTGATRLEDLLDQKWDAFVFFEDGPTKLLANYRRPYAKLLFQIARDGAGIVMVDYEDPKVLKEKNLLPTPASLVQSGNLKTTCYKVARGRGVQLQGFDISDEAWRNKYGYARGNDALVIDYEEGWQARYDDMFRQIGQAVLWTIGKERPVFALKVTPGTVSVSGEFPEQSSLELYLSGGGDRHDLLRTSPKAGQQTLSAQYGSLPPGTYFAVALIRQGQKAYAFASERVVLPKTPGHQITSLSFTGDRYAGKLGDTLTGTIDYLGQGTVTLRLRDTARRILREIPLAGKGGKAAFSFVLEDWMPPTLTVEATLSDGGKIIDRTYRYANKIIRRPKMFEFSAWGDARTHNSVHNLDCRLAELGITSLMRPGYQFKHSPWGMQDYQLNSAHVFDTIPSTNPRSCFFSEARRKTLTDRFKKYTPSYMTGMRIISLGDEVQEHYGCLAPDCLRRYREFLKEKYRGDLARLNGNWKTSFASWDQVGLSMIPEKRQGKDLETYVRTFMGTENRVNWNHLMPHYTAWLGGRNPKFSKISETYAKNPRARRFWENEFLDQEAGSFLAGNYSRWIDRQDFKSFAYSETNRFMKEYFQKIDPYILGGMEGTGGIDFLSHPDRMVETQGWMGNYADCNQNQMNEIFRSISPDDYITDSWVGYTTSATMLCDRVWKEMFRRPAMIMFYTTIGMGMPSYYGLIRPDYSIHTAAGELLRQTEKLRNGLGSSLLRSKAVNDPVAVLYSYPSAVFASRIYHGDSYDFSRFSHNGAMAWIMGLGYSFRYVTDTRLANGKDSLKDYKVLFLPRASAISDELIRDIREFVANGGTVIADIRAGVMDQFLIRRKQGGLDDLAGIARTDLLPASLENLRQAPDLGKIRIEPGVKVTAGKALWQSQNNHPALILKRHGKGMFLTVNMPFDDLKSPEQAPEPLLALLRQALAAAGPQPAVLTHADTGAAVLTVRRGEWRNGDMLIMGFKGKMGAPLKVKATLKKPQYVVGIDTEKNYGKTETVAFDMKPPKPEYFVVTDRPLPDISLTVTPTVRRGEDVIVTYQVKGMSGERPLLLSYQRNGKTVELYNRREVCANGTPRQIRFKIAVDEGPGTYVLRARDVYTGKVSVFPIAIH